MKKFKAKIKTPFLLVSLLTITDVRSRMELLDVITENVIIRLVPVWSVDCLKCHITHYIHGRYVSSSVVYHSVNAISFSLFIKLLLSFLMLNLFFEGKKIVFLLFQYVELWIENWSIFRRRVNCSKFICSKKLLDTKISTAQHRSSRCQKNENCSKIKKTSFQADASFRPKWTTARIATAWQKHW